MQSYCSNELGYRPPKDQIVSALAGPELSPEDTSLLTQQGGTLAFKGSNLVFKHMDSGILGQLKDTDALLAAVAVNSRAESALQLQIAPHVD